MEEMECPRCYHEFQIDHSSDNYFDGECPRCGLGYYWEEFYDSDTGEEDCYRIWGECGKPYTG